MRGVSTTDEGESRSVVPLVEVEGNVVDYVDASSPPVVGVSFCPLF